MPDTIAPSPATSISLSGNSAGSAPPRMVGAKPLKIQWDFASPRRTPARPGTPRKTRGLLTHRQLRCNTTDRPATPGIFAARHPLSRYGPATTGDARQASIPASPPSYSAGGTPLVPSPSTHEPADAAARVMLVSLSLA